MGVLGGLILKPTAGEVPIMSFQTDKNGTFDPSLTIASGTLKWIIDDVEFITNTPSVALTGSLVDVEVFANDVSEGDEVTAISFGNQDIISETSLAWFKINGSVLFSINPLITAISFSSFANFSNDMRLNSTGVSSIDLTNVELSESPTFAACTSLSSITFSTIQQTLVGFRADGTIVNSLDFSNITFTGAGTLRITIPSLTSLAFKNTAQSLAEFRGNGMSVSALDISMFTITNIFFVQSNINLTSLVPPSIYGTGLIQFFAGSCALDLTSVDLIFSTLNTYFSSNAPTSNLLVQTNLGTNASPTGGASNTDLVNLRDVVYPNAGFTFTANIN